MKLQEAIDYVPTCLVCNKEMNITLDATVNNELKTKDKHISFQKSHPTILLELKDGLLIAKNKYYTLEMNPVTNEIIGGTATNNIVWSSTNLRKSCATCHCKIFMSCKVSAPKEKIFPDLTLNREELRFTMKGGKSLRIDKYYRDDADNKNASIVLDNKYLPPLPFNFNKFTGFDHLLKRIATLVTFH